MINSISSSFPNFQCRQKKESIRLIGRIAKFWDNISTAKIFTEIYETSFCSGQKQAAVTQSCKLLYTCSENLSIKISMNNIRAIEIYTF